MKKLFTLFAALLCVAFVAQAECTTITVDAEHPFTEGFEGADLGCWTEQQVDGNFVHWILGAGASWYDSAHAKYNAAHGGSQNVCIGASYAATTKLISPVFDLTACSTPSLQFYLTNACWTSDQDVLKVYYRVSEDSEWVLLETFDDDVPAWAFTYIQLPNPSATYQIAFEASVKYGYGVLIDDVVVTNSPAPFHAPALAVVSKHYVSTYSWDHQDAAVSYQTYFVKTDEKPTAEDLETAEKNTTTAETITYDNLTPYSTYYFCVRAFNGTEYSDWIIVKTTMIGVTFTTRTISATDTTITYNWNTPSRTFLVNHEFVVSTIELTDEQLNAATPIVVSASSNLVGNETYVLKENINPNTTYYVYHRVIMDDGISSWYNGSVTTLKTIVKSLTAKNVTAEGATLSWFEAFNETTWKYVLSTNQSLTDEQLEEVALSTTANPLVLTGLSEATDYAFYIRPDGIKNKFWTSVKFSTLNASAIVVTNDVPYSFGWENGLVTWTASIVNGSYNWGVGNGACWYNSNVYYGGAHTGDYNIYYGSTWRGSTVDLVSPEFDISSVTTPYLSFYLANKAWDSDQDELLVFYRTSSSAEWTQLADLKESLATWTYQEFALPEKSANYQFKFQAISNYGYGIAIDDVLVENNVHVSTPIVTLTDAKVYAAEHRIVVENATSPVIIYDVMGRVVATSSATSPTFAVPQGIYLVRIADGVTKIAVR